MCHYRHALHLSCLQQLRGLLQIRPGTTVLEDRRIFVTAIALGACVRQPCCRALVAQHPLLAQGKKDWPGCGPRPTPAESRARRPPRSAPSPRPRHQDAFACAAHGTPHACRSDSWRNRHWRRAGRATRRPASASRNTARWSGTGRAAQRAPYRPGCRPPLALPPHAAAGARVPTARVPDRSPCHARCGLPAPLPARCCRSHRTVEHLLARPAEMAHERAHLIEPPTVAPVQRVGRAQIGRQHPGGIVQRRRPPTALIELIHRWVPTTHRQPHPSPHTDGHGKKHQLVEIAAGVARVHCGVGGAFENHLQAGVVAQPHIPEVITFGQAIGLPARPPGCCMRSSSKVSTPTRCSPM